MKIGILSRKADCYSTKRLVQAGTQRGHYVEVIDTLRCYMNITSSNPTIHYMGKDLDYFDAIIPRISSKISFYGTAVVRQFEMMGVYVLNESVAIQRARDKLRALQLLSRKGIGLPITGYANSPDDINDLIEMTGGQPLVIKLLEGTQGIGVVLAETKAAAMSVIQAFMGLNANIMVQEFIKEANDSDIRCFVIGDKVVTSIERTAAQGDFRANIHRGGSAKQIKITPVERKTAVDATRAMGLRIAGVDIIRSNRGPLVLEVNASPGLEGIETTTHVNVASKIIEYIEKTMNDHKLKAQRVKGKG